MPVSFQTYMGLNVQERGLAMIINVSKCVGKPELQGAKKDVENMKRLWVTFGFKN